MNLIDCVLELDVPPIIQALHDKYYQQLEKGQRCFLFGKDNHRIGQIYDFYIQYDKNSCKLIGKCEIWQPSSLFDTI